MNTTTSWSVMAKEVVWQHRLKGITLVVAIMFVSIATSVIHADIVKGIVSAVISLNRDSLLQVLFWLIGVTLVTALLKVLIANWTFFFRKKVRITLEDQGIAALYQTPGQPPLTHDEIMSLLQNTVERVVTGLLTTANDAIVTVTQIIAAVIYSVQISWELVVLCFVICGIMLALSYKNQRQIPQKMRQVGESFNKVYSVIWDHLHNAEVASFLNRNRVFAHLEETIGESSDSLVAANKVQNLSRIFSRFASLLIVMLTALYGGFRAINYDMEIANILALIIILQILADAIFKLPALLIDVKKVQGEGQVLDKLYQMVGNRQDLGVGVTKEFAGMAEKIILESVCYQPEGAVAPIVNIDSALVKKGQILCIAGASGSGKITLLHICAGLLPNYQGTVSWDDTELAKIDPNSLWRQIHLIEQTSVCLPTTIKNNIILDDQKYDLQRLQLAITDAGLTNYIGQLPEGVETEVTRGQLSTGELQKLSIARAFYQQKPILLWDEATSALDPAAEGHLLRALTRRVREEGLMIIAVTHRINFLAHSDQVLFLQKDGPSIFGTHMELLGTSPAYQEMIRDKKEGSNDA